jgi:hypothetical protein
MIAVQTARFAPVRRTRNVRHVALATIYPARHVHQHVPMEPGQILRRTHANPVTQPAAYASDQTPITAVNVQMVHSTPVLPPIHAFRSVQMVNGGTPLTISVTHAIRIVSLVMGPIIPNATPAILGGRLQCLLWVKLAIRFVRMVTIIALRQWVNACLAIQPALYAQQVMINLVKDASPHFCFTIRRALRAALMVPTR